MKLNLLNTIPVFLSIILISEVREITISTSFPSLSSPLTVLSSSTYYMNELLGIKSSLCWYADRVLSKEVEVFWQARHEQRELDASFAKLKYVDIEVWSKV